MALFVRVREERHVVSKGWERGGEIEWMGAKVEHEGS
jgi:hypothetical protein